MDTKNTYPNQSINLFGDVFLISLAMVIPILNIICLIYWAIKKNTRLLKIGLAIFTTILIAISATLFAFCTVYKVSPVTLVKNGRFYIEEDVVKVNKSGLLNVGGKMLQISSEDDLAISYDSQKVVLYTTDMESRLVLYEDSGIEVGSLSKEDLSKEMKLEDPADRFDVYDEKYYALAERLGINKKDSYVAYTQGDFEYVSEETGNEISGTYTEVYVLQDIGAETYLRIRIADYTGESPEDLIAKYTLTITDIIY